MTKPNALSAFINEAKTPEQINEKIVSNRKSKSESTGKSFPFRLSDDDHRALKMLAVRDGTSMQSMIFASVQALAEKRGVKLKG